jgi:outer membrane autotransporter protein
VSGGTSSSSTPSSPCAFDARGLQSTVVSAATMAVPLAISNALSGALAARNAPGVTRSSLGTPDQKGMAAAAGGDRWNAWAGYGYTSVGYSFAPLQSSGDVNLGLLGLDYSFTGNVLAGVAVSYDRTRTDTHFNRGELNGHGYTVSPYLAWQINRAWLFDASLGWGRAELDQSDFSAGGVFGSPKDDRFFGSLSLSYNVAFDKILLTGKGTYLWTEDKIDTFLLSDGTVIPGQTTRVKQLRLGGQVAYAGAQFMPFFGLYLIHDTQRPDQTPVGGFVAANDDTAWQAQFGVNFISKGPVYGGILFATEQGRSEVRNNQFLLNVGVRF